MREDFPFVLIVSAAQDLHATTVAGHVEALGARAEIFDLSDYPASTALSMRFGGERRSWLRLASGEWLDAEAVTSVWWRRPQRPRVSAQLCDPRHRQFAYNEAALFLNGFWQSLGCRWVNPVAADTAAAFKPYQLHVAREAGLRVPDTLITNDPEAALGFVERHGGDVVYKAMAGLPPDAWRETRLLRPEERAFLPLVRHAPVVFQECLRGPDLRVTVIGESLFAAEMQSGEGRYPYDVRMDMTVPVHAAALDEETALGIRALMGRLGLAYGAIDLKRDAEGRPHFLEINPAGQFLFVEELAGLPISRALARYLVGGGQEERHARQGEALVGRSA